MAKQATYAGRDLFGNYVIHVTEDGVQYDEIYSTAKRAKERVAYINQEG